MERVFLVYVDERLREELDRLSGYGFLVHLLQGEGEVALQVPVGRDHGEGQVVGVAVHVYPQDPVLLGVDGWGSPSLQVKWA